VHGACTFPTRSQDSAQTDLEPAAPAAPVNNWASASTAATAARRVVPRPALPLSRRPPESPRLRLCSADVQLRLSSVGETTGLRYFHVQASSRGTVIGVPLAIASLGRNRTGCAAHPAAAASACDDTSVLSGFPAGPRMQQWVLQSAGRDAAGKQLVYAQNQVGGWVGWWLGWLGWLESAGSAGDPVHLAMGALVAAAAIAAAVLLALGYTAPLWSLASSSQTSARPCCAGTPAWLPRALPGRQRQQLQHRGGVVVRPRRSLCPA
jgi:hypothetical protein